MANTIISLQILPKTNEDIIPYVDHAISIIQDEGVTYEVNPLDTVMEGDYDHLMTIVKRINEAMVSMGSAQVLSQIKVLYRPEGVQMNDLTEKHR